MKLDRDKDVPASLRCSVGRLGQATDEVRLPKQTLSEKGSGNPIPSGMGIPARVPRETGSTEARKGRVLHYTLTSSCASFSQRGQECPRYWGRALFNPFRTRSKQKGRLAETANATVLAGCLTAGLFLALPYVHVVEPPEKPELELMTIERTDWQAPPPLPLPPQIPQAPDRDPMPKPQLTAPRPDMVPLQTVLDVDLRLARIGGDFDLNFSVEPGATAMDGTPVFALSDIDRAPQPLVQLRPFYPAHARMRQIEGSVTVEFVVAADGKPEAITVLSSEPGTLFRSAAVGAVERWRFAPGTRGGTPVAVRVRQRIRFQLENGQ